MTRRARSLVGLVLILVFLITMPRAGVSGVQAQEAAPIVPPGAAEAAQLVSDGLTALQQGDAELALALFERAAQRSQGLEDSTAQVTALVGVGLAATTLGRHAHAAAAYERATALERSSGSVATLPVMLTSLGLAYRELGESERALGVFDEALQLARAAGDRTMQTSLLNHLGNVADRLGRYPEAIAHLEQALQLATDANNIAGVTTALNNLGVLYQRVGRMADALVVLPRALEQARSRHDPASEATALNNLGQAYERLGQPAEATVYYEAALALRIEQGDRLNAAIVLNNLGTVAEKTGAYTRAQELFERAGATFRELGERAGEAAVLTNLGSIALDLGQYEQAVAHYEHALAIRRQLRDPGGEGIALNNLGLAHRRMGQPEAALAFLNQALALQRQIGDRPSAAVTLNNLGLVYRGRAQYQLALIYYQEALDLHRALGNRMGEGTTLNNLGSVYLALGLETRALEAYASALAITREVGDRAGEATTLSNIGGVYSQVGLHQEALAAHDEALALATSLGDRSSEASVLLSLATEYQALEQLELAFLLATQALALQQELGERANAAITLNNLGAMYEASGDDTTANQHYELAWLAAREVGDRELEGAALGNAGVLAERLGMLDRALDFYQAAITVFEDIQAGVTVEEYRSGLSETAGGAYERAARLLVRLGRPVDAFDLGERARARILLEQLARGQVDVQRGANTELLATEQTLRAEIGALRRALTEARSRRAGAQDPAAVALLEGQLATRQANYAELLARLKLDNPEYAALVTIAPLTVGAVQELLDDETTLLSYFVTAEVTLAFVLTRQTFVAHELPVSKTALRNALERRPFASERAPLETLNDLYQALISPVQGHLQTARVGIIPHGVLHYLPFAALRDGGVYFGERHILFSLPSASILPFLENKQKNQQEPIALVVAQGLHTGNLPLLPNVDQEARFIAELFAATALVGNDATEAAVKARAPDASLLHIASHGELNHENPLFSRLVLAPSAGEDGSLEVHEVYALNLARTELVVLSACETSLGARSRGDDVVGLQRAFVYAGAPSVVASLWSVSDVATGELMRAFYLRLSQGQSKAVALQGAQAEIRERWPHPFYWAAFVLTGSPY